MPKEKPEKSAENSSRRAFLSGSIKAMPIALTLQSGAALARSSNLISTIEWPEVDHEDRVICLDLSSVDRVRGSRHVYDLGEPARARVRLITERKYLADPDEESASMTAAEYCKKGGRAYYHDPKAASRLSKRDAKGEYVKTFAGRGGAYASAVAISSVASGRLKVEVI